MEAAYEKAAHVQKFFHLTFRQYATHASADTIIEIRTRISDPSNRNLRIGNIELNSNSTDGYFTFVCLNSELNKEQLF